MVQILTTSLLSWMLASALSRLMFFLMKTTALYAPVTTAWVAAPVNQ